MRMDLLIDIGNTSAKIAVAEPIRDSNQSSEVGIVHFERLSEPWHVAFARLRSIFGLSSVRISSVAGEDVELNAALEEMGVPIIRLTAEVPCPVKPVQNVPQTLGADRWAADIGALSQDPNSTLLVIDAGTCLTYDVISREGVLLGGAISPGVQLRLNAMHEHTALLPLVEAEDEAVLMGYDTRTAMLSAAVNGTRFEMEGYIRQLLCEYSDLHVFITGGNTFSFSQDVRSHVTHDPYLVFRGLRAL